MINDLLKTIDQVVRGSRLPLSIIIVGVGDEDFQAMVELDADQNPLYSQIYGKQEADMVQFVPYREFKDDPTSLAKETLKEVPEQLVNYFKRQGIVPNH